MSTQGTGATGVAKRYAQALFDLTEQQGAHDAVAGDLKNMASLMAEDADIARFIASPVLSRDDQVKGVGVIAEKAGFNTTTANFLGLVAKNRRLTDLSGMIAGYLSLLAASRGEVVAKVATARPLSDAQKSAVADALAKATGAKVQVEETVDPALLGGMVVTVGSRMIDSSIRSKLSRLKLSMKGVG